MQAIQERGPWNRGNAARRRESVTETVGWSIGLFALSIVGLVTAILVTTFVPLMIVGVGILATMILLPIVRGQADLHRQWAARRLGVDIPRPYRPAPDGGPFTRLFAALGDPATWRDYAWLWVSGTAGMALTLFVFTLWLSALFGLVVPLIWASAPETRGILDYIGPFNDGTSAVDYVTAPIMGLLTGVLAYFWTPKILDFYAQLGRWFLEPVGGTPAPAPARVVERTTDPGSLAGMVDTYARSLPVDVEVSSGLTERVHPALAAAAYFAVVEALSNVVAHSDAQHAWVDLRTEDGQLKIQVGDDGTGGATVTIGGGLHAAERRLGALGGLLAVSSPAGGPTIVNMEVPQSSGGSLPRIDAGLRSAKE